MWFYAAAYNSPYVLWLDDDTNDIAEIRHEIMSHWHEAAAQAERSIRISAAGHHPLCTSGMG